MRGTCDKSGCGTISNTLKYLEKEIGETRQERVGEIKARQNESDDENFDSCGEETVADSAYAAQFKKGSPTDRVDLISEGRECHRIRRRLDCELSLQKEGPVDRQIDIEGILCLGFGEIDEKGFGFVFSELELIQSVSQS